MKSKIVIAILFSLSTIIANAQQRNIFLTPRFWRDKPDVEKIKEEIAKGNNPAEKSTRGIDAIVLAIYEDAPNESIKYLIEQTGNKVNQTDDEGRSYIYPAASKGNIEIMEYLIGKGTNVNMVDSTGATALTYAAASGQTDKRIYDIFIREGSNPAKEKDRNGANVLLLIARFVQNVTLINYFVDKGVDIKSTDSNGSTVFDYALRGGHVDVLKALIAKGVKYDTNGAVAAAMGQRGSAGPSLELFQYLESLKLNLKATTETGDNALHYLAGKPKQAALINYLISKGVDVNKANEDGKTPLINASMANNDLETISVLARATKNINEPDNKGATALAYAVSENTPEVVKLLLDKGAEVQLENKEGDNMAYYLLSSFDHNPEGFETKLKLLQAKGFDVAATLPNGNNLYHLAVVNNSLPLLKRIESFAVDVNAKNKDGLTPLHKAALIAKNDAILKYLLSIGAKKELGTGFGETAYDLAKENEYLSRKKISIDFLK